MTHTKKNGNSLNLVWPISFTSSKRFCKSGIDFALVAVPDGGGADVDAAEPDCCCFDFCESFSF